MISITSRFVNGHSRKIKIPCCFQHYLSLCTQRWQDQNYWFNWASCFLRLSGRHSLPGDLRLDFLLELERKTMFVFKTRFSSLALSPDPEAFYFPLTLKLGIFKTREEKDSSRAERAEDPECSVEWSSSSSFSPECSNWGRIQAIMRERWLQGSLAISETQTMCGQD